jgi:phosphoglycolate phosphatase-like HAD superfamily hydrolase
VLLLFDIDGTLVRDAAREHAAAIMQAAREVHGLDALYDGPFEAAGRTDWAIARQLLRHVDDARVEALMPELLARAAALYDPPDLSHTVVPGVPAMLDAVAAEHRLALVTGNAQAIARRKLAAAGIPDVFAAGGFGDDHHDREPLPALARERAGGAAPHEAVVIGDTPRDIACARADGAAVIAVTTGPYGAHELQDADLVVPSAADVPDALAQLPRG